MTPSDGISRLRADEAAAERPLRVRPSWGERYAQGRVSESGQRELWADVDTGWVMVAELLAATFTWGGIGWLLDRWLETAPWLMSIGFLVGFATGFYLVWARSSGKITKPEPRNKTTSESRPDEPE